MWTPRICAHARKRSFSFRAGTTSLARARSLKRSSKRSLNRSGSFSSPAPTIFSRANWIELAPRLANGLIHRVSEDDFSQLRPLGRLKELQEAIPGSRLNGD